MNGLNMKNIMIEPTKDNTFCFYPFYALVFKLYDNQDLAAVAPCCMMHDTSNPNTGQVNSILSKKELNEKLYNLLEQFNVLTGVPIILNTSFNIKGQPIVNTPEEAINTFKTTKIDVLVLGNSFVIKDKNNQDI